MAGNNWDGAHNATDNEQKETDNKTTTQCNTTRTIQIFKVRKKKKNIEAQCISSISRFSKETRTDNAANSSLFNPEAQTSPAAIDELVVVSASGNSPPLRVSSVSSQHTAATTSTLVTAGLVTHNTPSQLLHRIPKCSRFSLLRLHFSIYIFFLHSVY